MELESPPYYSVSDSSERVVYIGNNVTENPIVVPDQEKSVYVKFIPDDFIQNQFNNLEMGISNLIPDTAPDEGTASSDSTNQFFKYATKDESRLARDWDDPALQDQKVFFDLALNGNQIFDDASTAPPSDGLTVLSRYNFLWEGTFLTPFQYSSSERAAKAIDFIIWKYDLSVTTTPTYDSTLTPESGITTPLGAVSLGDSAFTSEQLLASVIIHEQDHVNQSVARRTTAGYGKTIYSVWNGLGGPPLPLPVLDRAAIYTWVAVELEAILAQKTADVHQHLSSEDRDAIQSYNDEFIMILDQLAE